MLSAKRGNPNVVRRNWSSGSLEFGSKSCVRDGRLFIDIENPVSCESIRSAIVGTAAGDVIVEFHTGIRPTQLPARRCLLLCEESAPEPCHHLRPLTDHWCPGSELILGLGLAELFFNGPVDSLVSLCSRSLRTSPSRAWFFCGLGRVVYPPAPPRQALEKEFRVRPPPFWRDERWRREFPM